MIDGFGLGMIEPRRIVTGQSEKGAGDIASLAYAIAQEAKSLGFRVLGIKASRATKAAVAAHGSATKYIHLADRQDRTWLVRVSDHYRPRRVAHIPLHFDLVSLDRRSGKEDACEWLAQVARGEVAWVQPYKQTRRRGSRQRWKGARP